MCKELSLLFLSFILLQVWSSKSGVVSTHSVINFLPGYEGPLPFYLETGYVGLGENEEAQLFYYFVKSQGNVEEDPLLLWLSGGPGCTSFSGLVFQIGPIGFKDIEYNGSLPTLILRPEALTQFASIIFLDLPVGAGFSYAKTSQATMTGDFIQVEQADQFLRKWLREEHPEFLSNNVYVGGDSYSGITVPAIVQRISDGNEEGATPLINLKGYILGNPITDVLHGDNSRVPFAHGMGLISDELFQSLVSSCGGEYKRVDPENTECLKYLQSYTECLSEINTEFILQSKCDYPGNMIKMPSEKENKISSPSNECQAILNLDFLPAYWANDNLVRSALHVREGTIGEGKWIRCNLGVPYETNILNSVEYHANLGAKGYRSLIYNGDHDMLVTFLGTQAWIRSLNFSIVDDWRPWFHQDQIAGYTRTYTNKLTFATVKGAGHVATQDKVKECLTMFERWIHEKAL